MIVSISSELDILHIKVVGNTILRYVILTFKILVMHVLRRQIGSQTFIKTLGKAFPASFIFLIQISEPQFPMLT